MKAKTVILELKGQIGAALVADRRDRDRRVDGLRCARVGSLLLVPPALAFTHFLAKSHAETVQIITGMVH